MFANNIVSHTFKVFLVSAWEILFFPIWWYTIGLFNTLRSLFLFLANRERELSFSIWLKNLFVPMYGQNDIAGFMISFFVRLFQIIVRGFVLLIWLAICLVMLFVWLALPVFIVYQIIYQLN